MLAYLNSSQRRLTPDQLAQREFPLEILIAVLEKDTDKFME